MNKNTFFNKTLHFLISLSLFYLFSCNKNSSVENQAVAKECEEPSNPFSEGTGHFAGWAWAEEKSVSSCGGNSSSFIEGCEEYLSKEQEFKECQKGKQLNNG